MPVRRDVEAYQVTVARPDDFDEFWQGLMAGSAATPLNPSMVCDPMRSTADAMVYEIHYDTLDGLRLAGWYCVPREGSPPYPGLILVPGYISEPVLPKTWARRGYATVSVAHRGKLRSNADFNPGYPGVLVHNVVDRDAYAYRGIYVDAARAVDFLLSRPEVAHDRIGVHGSSQGGALTITTAALRRDVIACGVLGAPYLCGFLDAARLTRSYPYQEINDYLWAHPEREAQVRKTLAYFDGINFAGMIDSPMLMYLGLEDDVCPPETGFAVYRKMTCAKTLRTFPHSAHDAGAHQMTGEIEEFLAAHLGPVTPQTVTDVATG